MSELLEPQPDGVLHSTIICEPSYDDQDGPESSVEHSNRTLKDWGIGSALVELGYDGPLKVTDRPLGADDIQMRYS